MTEPRSITGFSWRKATPEEIEANKLARETMPRDMPDDQPDTLRSCGEDGCPACPVEEKP